MKIALYRDKQFYLEKFLGMCTKSETSQCTEWIRSKDRKGYGSFSAYGKQHRAHRWIWEFYYGIIPNGKVVMHTCDNPGCVNIAHLKVGTHKDNAQDRNSKNRQARGVRSGVNTKPETRQYGERCRKAKLTWRIVDSIRERSKQVSQRQVAKEFGLSPGQVNKIVKETHWKSKYRYLSDGGV